MVPVTSEGLRRGVVDTDVAQASTSRGFEKWCHEFLPGVAARSPHDVVADSEVADQLVEPVGPCMMHSLSFPFGARICG